MSSKAGPPPSPRYTSLLCEFMAYVHQKAKPYPKDHEFSEDELNAITPADMCRWMNVKAFGTPNPGIDARLTGAGSSSLEFMKKAISFYMPLKQNWDPDRGQGNPTRSKEVKEVMHRVSALGGKRKKESIYQPESHLTMEVVPSDGPVGLLNRMHTQNSEFIHILDTMETSLHTFTRSVSQMKSSLQTNNIAIRHELNAQANGGTAQVAELDAIMAQQGGQISLPTLASEVSESAGKVEESLQGFIDMSAVNTDMRVVAGSDGFTTFVSAMSGKHMDVPEGFTLPSVDLLTAWRHWLIGFPDYKIKNDEGGIMDCPIRPLRLVNTVDLPQTLRKKFKDGWRPILVSMSGDVAQQLENTPASMMDEKFIAQTYNVAMTALSTKAPAMFADSNSDKCSTWKVATWSRKIRENSLGQQQVRQSSMGGAVGQLKTEGEVAVELGQVPVPVMGAGVVHAAPVHPAQEQI